MQKQENKSQGSFSTETELEVRGAGTPSPTPWATYLPPTLRWAGHLSSVSILLVSSLGYFATDARLHSQKMADRRRR